MFRSKARIEQEKREAELQEQEAREREEENSRAREAKEAEYREYLAFLRGIFTSVKFPLLYYLALQALYNRQAVRITPRLLHDEVALLLEEYVYAKYHKHNTGDGALKVSWRALGIALKTLGLVENRVREGGRTRWYSINKDRVAKLVYLLGDDGMEGIIPYYDECQDRHHSLAGLDVYRHGDRIRAYSHLLKLFHSGWKGEVGERDSPFT